jgi:hypothetical protein
VSLVWRDRMRGQSAVMTITLSASELARAL